MKPQLKNTKHELTDIYIHNTQGGDLGKCLNGIFQNTIQPFNLFFGPVEDYKEVINPRKFSRYGTPYLLILPDKMVFQQSNWLEEVLSSVKGSGLSICCFDEYGKVFPCEASLCLDDLAVGIFIDRSLLTKGIPISPEIERIKQYFCKFAPSGDSWVDIAIANVRPNNGVLWETVEAILNRTDHPYRILITCGLRSLSANRNMGLQNATSDYVCLFDDDLVVNDSMWLTQLVETLLKEPDVAISGPKIVGKSGLIVRCGTDRLARPVGAGEPSEAHTGVFEVHTMSSCMLMKRKVVPKFDLLFPGAIAFEDIDHAYRLHRKGWRVMCDARVELTHLRLSTRSPLWTWNHLYYHLKHPTTLAGLGRVKQRYIE
jgi:hypothetical protein